MADPSPTDLCPFPLSRLGPVAYLVMPSAEAARRMPGYRVKHAWADLQQLGIPRRTRQGASPHVLARELLAT